MIDDSMENSEPDNSVFRILDAAINRAGEGLRVVEDYLRMVVADPHLSRKLKELRHDLTQIVSSIDPASRIAARDSERDVGRKIQTKSEYDRADAGNERSDTLVQANLARTQQSLRSIEEFSKKIDVNVAKQIEQLRYRTYTIEKAILTTVLSLRQLEDSRICVLVEADSVQSDPAKPELSELIELVQRLIDTNVGMIQLRDKRLSDRMLVRTGRAIAELTGGTQTLFIMNDRADLAVAARSDGVHLGQDDLSVGDARKILGAAKLIGVSTHTIEQARQAVLDGANYIGVGPVFPSTTKSFAAHVGLDFIKEVATEIQLPAFAIGGINLDNVSDVVAAGISRVAVSAAVAKAEDPAAAAAALMQLLA